MPTITNRHPVPRALLLLAMLVLLMFCTSCYQDPVTPEAGDALEPFPGTLRQLMTNFVAAHESGDFAAYRSLLRDDYIMLLQPATQEEFPDVGPTLDLAEELIIAERMFGGQAITNSQGDLVPGISAISFQIFEQQDNWTTSQPTDVIPNARAAQFEVTFLFDRQGDSTLRVDGLIKFYVTSRDSVVNDVTKQYFQMVGQQDLTNGGTF